MSHFEGFVRIVFAEGLIINMLQFATLGKAGLSARVAKLQNIYLKYLQLLGGNTRTHGPFLFV